MPAPSTAACFGVSTFLVSFSLCFDVLIVQEDTDQRAGLVGVRQRDKALIFQLQRFFATKRAAASMVFTAVIGAG
jgi:hypothetical protein